MPMNYMNAKKRGLVKLEGGGKVPMLKPKGPLKVKPEEPSMGDVVAVSKDIRYTGKPKDKGERAAVKKAMKNSSKAARKKGYQDTLHYDPTAK